MPPTPPTAARRGARALLLIALPLLLGFATGALLASHPPPAQPARDERVVRPAPADTVDDRADRERRRARAPAAANASSLGVSAPTRRSVQEAIDAIDPRDWLASYGAVTETGRESSLVAH